MPLKRKVEAFPILIKKSGNLTGFLSCLLKFYFFYRKPLTMKIIPSISVFFTLVLLMSACDLIDGLMGKSDSNKLDGSTNLPINTVGNTFSNQFTAGTKTYSGTISVTDVTNGITTISFQFSVPNYPALQGIKSKYIDATGKISCSGKFKITDQGIMDYNNVDHEPFVLVKYDAKVGDKYTLKKSDGKTIVREVVRKSTDDDYFWGGMLIKTIDVEQSSNIPGVSKIVYFVNHKFGVVGVRFIMEDGSQPQLYLSSSKY